MRRNRVTTLVTIAIVTVIIIISRLKRCTAVGVIPVT